MQLELEIKQVKNESELKLKMQELAHEKQKLEILRKESEEELEKQKRITKLMISNQMSQSGRDAQSSQSSQTNQSGQSETIPSLSFLASQKGAFWLIGLEGGVGERFTPNYNDSVQAAFSFRTKVGGGYRWNADYALSGFLTYEATFQDKGIAHTEGEMHTTHSLGFGAMFQFLKYFYVSTGALVDTRDLGSDYISRTHENINPFIEMGGILIVGFSLGLRYVFALGDGNYLNRGISCSLGILFGI